MRRLTHCFWLGATHAPVFNSQGDKVAWLELDEDGYESDRLTDPYILQSSYAHNFYRAKIVVYDLTKNVRYTLTQKWDRSPESLAVNSSRDIIFRF